MKTETYAEWYACLKAGDPVLYNGKHAKIEAFTQDGLKLKREDKFIFIPRNLSYNITKP